MCVVTRKVWLGWQHVLGKGIGMVMVMVTGMTGMAMFSVEEILHLTLMLGIGCCMCLLD